MAELQRHEICARIKQGREQAGLSQPEMAGLLDVALRTYQNYERDRVPWDQMGRISDITGRSLRWLLHGEDDAEPSMAVMLRLAEIEATLSRLLKIIETNLADQALEGEPPEPGQSDDTETAEGR